MVFMQNGAPCYMSPSTLVYLDNKNVCILSDSPVESPDLNIIENMWELVKKNIWTHHPILKDNLWHVVQEEWYAIHMIT